MSCSNEQIAEKKRIALERLRAKQNSTSTGSLANQSNLPVAQPDSASKASLIAENKRIAVERLKTKQPLPLAPAAKTTSKPPGNCSSTANSNSASQFLSSNTFYASSPSTNFTESEKAKPYASNNRTSNCNEFGKAKSYSSNNRSQPYGPRPTVNNATNNNQTLAPVFQKTIFCPCSLTTASRFNVIPAAFHPKLVDAFKTIPSRSYDNETRAWSFHTDDYALVQERLAPLLPDVTLVHLPRFVVRLMQSKPKNLSTTCAANQACLNSLEPKIAIALFPFQRIGVMFGIEKQGRCMIADEMGLGKTFQALALADFYKHDWPLLICTTAATRDVWVSTIRELMPYVPKNRIACMLSNMESIAEFKVLIVSYNLMERNCEMLLQHRFNFVILDESHLLKNVKAKSTSAAIELAKRAKRVVCLTGTPALSRPSELFTQLQMIDPTFFSFKEYSTRYCDGKQTNFGWNATGQSNLDELNVVLRQKFMIRRTKQDVSFEMGEKSRETVLLDPALIWKGDETTENMESYANDFASLSGREREDVLLKYYNETANAKASAVGAYLKQLAKEKQKFIVFAHHRVMLDAISNCMKKSKVDFIRIDGTTKNELRTTYIERFQTKPECQVAVLSLKACNAGITLTAAQLVLFAELDWNPSTLAQAESRAHRIGQTGDVICRYLLAKGTADDIIWEMLKTKQDTLNKAGLFSDDLADGTVCIAPTSSETITKFLTVTNKKASDTRTATETIDVPPSELDLSGFLDGDDEDFASIPC